MTDEKTPVVRTITLKTTKNPLDWSPEKYAAQRLKRWKANARELEVELKPNRYYSVKEVSALLNISYDLALTIVEKMPNVLDLGHPETLHKRGKRILRVKGTELIAFVYRRSKK